MRIFSRSAGVLSSMSMAHYRVLIRSGAAARSRRGPWPHAWHISCLTIFMVLTPPSDVLYAPRASSQYEAQPKTIHPGEKPMRSEEHTSELQSLMRISYAVFCLKKKNTHNNIQHI